MIETLIFKKELNTMKANIRGRLAKLRNVSSFREPLLEAVANSFQSLEVSKVDDPHIEIRVFWDQNPRFAGKGKKKPYHVIKTIEIEDNGEGFTKRNFDSFETMDSDLKAKDFGCKGIGRFLWLKAFEKVSVKSVYLSESGEKKYRSFTFTVDDISNHVDKAERADAPCVTTVTLEGLRDGMQKKSDVFLEEIVDAILHHFLLDFVNGTAPKIKVIGDGCSLSVNDAFKGLNSSASVTDTFSFEEFPEYTFELIQQRLGVEAKKGLSSGIYYCAGGRVVCKAKTSLDVKFDSITNDLDGNELLYIGLLKSQLLDELVNNERNFIDFESVVDLKAYPNEKDVLERSASLCRTYLKPEFDRLEQKSKAALRKFVDNVAPEYKGYFNRYSDDLFVNPDSSSSEIRDYVSKKYFQYEREQISAVDKLIEVDWSGEDAEKKICEIEEKIRPIAAHDLVRFAAQRAYYLKMFAKAIKLKNKDGETKKEYQLEDVIHSLIFPMETDSTDSEGMAKQNLWLIDDRLTFNHYLSSDKAFSKIPVVSENSLKRPDIFHARLYSLGDHPSNAMELSIIEFKRPGREDYSLNENPLTQVLDYARRIRKGNEKTIDGEEITNHESMPINCYVVAQLTENLLDSCVMYGLQQNASKDSYYGYNSNLHVYIEVMSLNALFRKAKERNHALLKAAKLTDLHE